MALDVHAVLSLSTAKKGYRKPAAEHLYRRATDQLLQLPESMKEPLMNWLPKPIQLKTDANRVGTRYW